MLYIGYLIILDFGWSKYQKNQFQGPVLSPNDHPNPSKGQWKGFMKTRISKNFHVPLHSLYSAKTAKSSLPRGHMGGADWGYLELGPGTPAMGKGVHIQEKSSSGPRSKYTHSGHNTQRSFAPPPPPPPPPPKKGYPGAGGYGGQNPKNHWGIIFGPKNDDFTRG